MKNKIATILISMCVLLAIAFWTMFFTYKETYRFYTTTGQIKSFHQIYMKNYPTDKWAVKIIEDGTGKEITSEIIKDCNKRAVLSHTKIYVRETTGIFFHVFKIKGYYVADGDFCLPDQKPPRSEIK